MILASTVSTIKSVTWFCLSLCRCMWVCAHMWPLDGRMQLTSATLSGIVCVGVCVLQDSSSLSLQQSMACDVPEKKLKSHDRNCTDAKDKYRAPHLVHFSSLTHFLFCHSLCSLLSVPRLLPLTYTHMKERGGRAFVTQGVNTWHTFKQP